MINNTTEKITLLFYKLWSEKGIVTDEPIAIETGDDIDFECDDEPLRQKLLSVVDGNIVLFKNALTFMEQENIFSCKKRNLADRNVILFGITMEPKAIKMVEGLVSGNKDYQKQYNKTFALNLNFSAINLGSFLDARLGDVKL